ncbi:substrate-binding domain-containing protein [Faecalibacterium sp. 7]|uniref:substrate-binding domain-containing protein n=1 Tax=Faecalibacterium sp. 7 TaxID=3402017 RepID=UPI003C2AB65E
MRPAPQRPDPDRKRHRPGSRSAIARGRRETAALLAQQPDTDSILCATDLLAIGCLQELQARGIAVPQQVAVAGVDNTLYGQLCSPALTTLDNRLAEVSQTAAALLLDLLQGKEVPHRQVLPAAVIVREST